MLEFLVGMFFCFKNHGLAIGPRENAGGHLTARTSVVSHVKVTIAVIYAYVTQGREEKSKLSLSGASCDMESEPRLSDMAGEILLLSYQSE